ncbi:unnamed protein product [Arabis nemorensis]|uniref:Reverse transcriptase zinc-binding domain-containing protein n=1 Tax=Arabis nemorensis TaxID=586526 RepID=A0A565BPY6_9BRAS|nr:unnamed protein product [Arabis nemorensis]
MTKHDYQPLVEKIPKQFSYWTVRHLSFAERLEIIQSVIYSKMNLWASIFILLNHCIATLEQMCNAFLWKGVPNYAIGAKIAWESVCTSKKSGGLGLRRLLDWNKVIGLKLIWLIFTSSGSLWVSWVRPNLIKDGNLWDMESASGSWIWKQLLKLRHLARPFIICEIGSGITSSFWQDNWTSLGPLIDITGRSGPSRSGLPIDAVVSDAIRNGRWWIDGTRSRNSIISLLRQCLPPPTPIAQSDFDDYYKWKINQASIPKLFSLRNFESTSP